MRPNESFGRPRPPDPMTTTPGLEAAPGLASSAAGDPGADIGGPAGAGLGVFLGGSSGNAVGAVLGSSFDGCGGAGSTAPMMTYFLAEEAELDAAAGSSHSQSHSHSHLRELDSGKLRQQLRQHQHQHQRQHPRHTAHQLHKADAVGPAVSASRAAGNAEPFVPRPSTPTTAGRNPSPLPNLSPLLSQSTTPSFFGTSAPTSLAALSASSSRRNSFDSSVGNLGSAGGGESILSRDPSFELDRAEAGVASASASAAVPIDDTPVGTITATATTTSAAASTLLANNTSMANSGIAPQLIMPSIRMPSRRPFTERGKSMGRLKVLIAGDTGVGKTSLVKAIVQSCEHIVHVDHITPPPVSLGTSRRSSAATVTATVAGTYVTRPDMARARRRSSRMSRSARPDQSTGQITEIFASTKPYPAWWSELPDAHGGLHRRKSLGDNVLDRNICFVDTPGYSGNTSTMDVIMPVVQYVEGYLQRLCSNSLSDADFIGIVSGDGGAAVDVVFYLISDDLKPADIDYLRRLTPLTNVIPLVARADALRSDHDVAAAKERVARQLHEAGIDPFVFSAPTPSQDLAIVPASTSGLPQPYAVSSANGSDHDVMDASLLMSPEYVQPLVPTELAALVEQVFCPDGVTRLRHAAARKIAQWRRSSCSAADSSHSNSHANDSEDSSSIRSPHPQSLYRPLSLAGSQFGGGSPAPLTLAQLGDHMQREEYMARVRLSTWAASLQRSLDSERVRFEALARSERAVWLTERLGECVQDGTLVAVPSSATAAAAAAAEAVASRQHRQTTRAARNGGSGSGSGNRGFWVRRSAKTSSSQGSSTRRSPSSLYHEDPLGLLEVTAGLQARARVVLEVVGGMGLMGGVVLWVTRHNYHVPVYAWLVDEWARLWNEL